MSWRRIRGIARRHWLTLRRSWPRMFEIFFWPVVEIIVWGLVTLYLLRLVGAAIVPGYFLGGMILWILLNRSQEDLAISVLEETWSDNFINLAASPLRPLEYVLGSGLVGLFKAVISATAMSGLALLMYEYNVLSIGPTLPFALLALVLNGWALGLLTIGLILRYGRRVDILAWSFSHLIQPLACAVYPVQVLPPALQLVAGLIPASHAFEASRAALAGEFAAAELIAAIVSGLIWLVLSALFCQAGLTAARQSGRLATLGE